MSTSIEQVVTQSISDSHIVSRLLFSVLKNDNKIMGSPKFTSESL